MWARESPPALCTQTAAQESTLSETHQGKHPWDPEGQLHTGIKLVTSLGLSHRVHKRHTWIQAEVGSRLESVTPGLLLAVESPHPNPRIPFSCIVEAIWFHPRQRALHAFLLGTSSSPGNPPPWSTPPPVFPQRGWRRGSVWQWGNLIPDSSPHRNQSFQCPWPRLGGEPAEGGNRDQRLPICGGRRLPLLLLFFRGTCSRGSQLPDALHSPLLDTQAEAEAPEGLLPAWGNSRHTDTRDTGGRQSHVRVETRGPDANTLHRLGPATAGSSPLSWGFQSAL